MYEDVRKLQVIQLDILRKVIELCEKHNITYFAAYGTLLGAVRHKGFIPWDDDIDLNMPRPDYDRFCEIATKELKSPYFLQTHSTDSACRFHAARVQNVNTTYMVKDQPKDQVSGIFIDIMPLDGCLANRKDIFKFRTLYKIYKYCAIDWFDLEEYPGKKIKRFIGTVAQLFLGRHSHEYFFALQETMYKQIPYDTATHISDYSGECGPFKKEYFEKKIYLDFEDIQICCPAAFDMLLRSIFGDYMTPPPKDERIPHHKFLAVDTEKSYTQYLDVFENDR